MFISVFLKWPARPIDRRLRSARGRSGTHRLRFHGLASTQTTVSPRPRNAAMARRSPAASPQGARMAALSGRGAATATSAFRSRLKPTAARRSVAAEHGAHLVVAAAAHHGVACALRIDGKAGAAVVGVATQIGQVERHFGIAQLAVPATSGSIAPCQYLARTSGHFSPHRARFHRHKAAPGRARPGEWRRGKPGSGQPARSHLWWPVPRAPGPAPRR